VAQAQQQQQVGMASPRAASAPVAILWDIENCPVPVEVNAEDVAGNIRIALREHPNIGAVTMFSAYGDFNHFPKKVREGCQRTGVNLIDVPNGKKDAADKAILVDMFLFALDNPPPSTIFLVTGDVDFAPALHKLGQRGYVVVLVIPDGVGVSPALRGAGRYVWDWPSLCRGRLEVPSSRRRYLEPQQQPPPLLPTTPNNDDDDDHVQGEEILVPRKVPFSFIDHGHQPAFVYSPRTARSVTATSPSLRNSYVGRAPFPNPDGDLGFANSDAAELVPTSPGGGGNWVQPGDLAGLKKQLVWLVTSHGGKMTLVKVSSEYQKQYGRPLYLAEYNVAKLVHLVEKMKDSLVLKGEGPLRTLHLVERAKGHNKYKPSPRRLSVPKDSEDSDPEVKETIKAEFAVPEGVSKRHLMDMDMDEVKPAALGALPPDWESVAGDVKAKLDPIKVETVVDEAEDFEEDLKLALFKHELQALLVAYSWSIPLETFVELYKNRYARTLDFHSFGVTTLEALFQKVKDVAVLKERAGMGDAKEVYVAAV
jgi:hypothetical protein